MASLTSPACPEASYEWNILGYMTHRLALPPPGRFGFSFLYFSLIRSHVAGFHLSFLWAWRSGDFCPRKPVLGGLLLGCWTARTQTWVSLKGGRAEALEPRRPGSGARCPLSSCVTSGKSLCPSEPQFSDSVQSNPHLLNPVSCQVWR